MSIFKYIVKQQHYELKSACVSHKGYIRQNNEDNFCFDGQCMPADNTGQLIPLKASYETSRNVFFSVFDGMGGTDYGEIASFTAAKTAILSYADLENKLVRNPKESLNSLCKLMNETVYCKGKELSSRQMGTTMVSLLFQDACAWVCNVGDSRCILLRDGVVYQLSKDHSDEAFMKEHGITGRKPYLTQFIGTNPNEVLIEPFIRSVSIKKGDRFLLCSDGITDMIRPNVVRKVLSETEKEDDCACRLVEEALSAGGKDNITVIVITIE